MLLKTTYVRLLVSSIVIGLWGITLLGVARLSSDSSERTDIRLLKPAFGEPLFSSSDDESILRWQLEGVSNCWLTTGKGADVPIDPHGRTVLDRSGFFRTKYALLRVVCDDTLMGRWVRPLSGELDAAETDGQVEVARAHVDAEKLESVVAQTLPEILNPVLHRELHRLSKKIRRESSQWRLPGWLVDGVELEPSSRVVVRSARVIFEEQQFSIALNIDASFDVAVLNRPVIAPKKRGTRKIKFTVEDHFRPVLATFALHPSSGLSVQSIRLHGRFCRTVDRDLFREVCERVVHRIYRRIEEVLEREVQQSATHAIQTLHVQELIRSSVKRWAGEFELGELAAALLDGAELRLSRSEQDEAGLHMSVEASESWVQSYHGYPVHDSKMKPVKDTSATLDLGVRVAFVNRLLAQAFDRPLRELAVRTAPLVDNEKMTSEIQRLRAFFGADDQSRDNIDAVRPDTMTALLRLASMKVYEDASIQPSFGVTPQGQLLVSTAPMRVVRNVEGGVFVTIAAQLQVDITQRDGVFWASLDQQALEDAVALDVETTSSNPEAMRASRRARAAVQQFYGSVRQKGAASRITSTTPNLRVIEWLKQVAEIPLFPGIIESNHIKVAVRVLQFRHSDQSIVLQSDVRMK